MKMSEKKLERKAEEALRACLSKVPFLKIKNIQRQPRRGDITPDMLVTLKLPDAEKIIVVELKSNGQPRLARAAVNQLLRHKDVFPGAYGVFMAPYISPQAAEICEKDGIGYVDLSSNCSLCFGQVYIEQKGKPNLFAEKRDLRSLYSPKAERVLRVLLNNPNHRWKVKELSDEAAVSLGQVSNIKKLLSDREWIHTNRDGFFLNAPDLLLAEWAENYTYRKNSIRNFYSLSGIAEIEATIAEVCSKQSLTYALTGFSGAARLAPTVKYQRVFAYIEDTEKNIAKPMNVKEVQSGANLSILTPYDDGVFYGDSKYDGVNIASPIQIYLDLLGFRGRGEEAANALFNQIIRPRW